MIALLLDGETVRYGRGGSTGALHVSHDAPQSLVPILFRHGPLAAGFTRTR